MAWRWDQGRKQYFLFENIQLIAKELVLLDGADMSTGVPDPLRAPLEAATGLVFRPHNYKVWRNHSRIFACCMLASKVSERLAVTDVCRGLSRDDDDRLDMDSYLSVVIPRFSYPYPALDDYSATEPQIFPFCATLKLLLHGSATHVDSSLDVDDIAGRIIGNGITGFESPSDFRALTDSGHRLTGDDKRQLREMLSFLSQSSFLKLNNSRLYLDVIPGDVESIAALEYLATPQTGDRLADASLEILWLGADPRPEYERVISVTRRQQADIVFTEGSRVRMTHLRTERSPILRNALFASLSQPYVCDVCGRDMRAMYPWTENILEVHHLLPLSASVNVGETSTSLADVAANCPNCHRSIHIYYKRYLNVRGQNDFISRAESRQIYSEAKASVVT